MILFQYDVEWKKATVTLDIGVYKVRDTAPGHILVFGCCRDFWWPYKTRKK